MTDLKKGEKQFFPHDYPLGLKKGHNNMTHQTGQVKHLILKIKKGNPEVQKELCSHYF